MIAPGTGVRVYLACGVTDMRKGIAGLSAIAQDVLRQKPTGGAVFAFRGRRGDRVKLLFLGWAGLLPVLQGASERAFPLAFCIGWLRAFDLGADGHVVGGDRLAQARLGRAAGSGGVIYLHEMPCFYGNMWRDLL